MGCRPPVPTFVDHIYFYIPRSPTHRWWRSRVHIEGLESQEDTLHELRSRLGRRSEEVVEEKDPGL